MRVVMLTGVAAGVVLCAAVVAQPQTRQPSNLGQLILNAQPLQLLISNTKLTLEAAGEPGSYQSAGVAGLSVGSFMPKWTIIAVASPAQGPGGASIPPDKIFITPFNVQGGLSSGSRPLNLGRPVIVATGGATVHLKGGMAQVAALGLAAKIDPAQPAGVYTGTISFHFNGAAKTRRPSRSLIRSTTRPSPSAGALSYTVAVAEYLTVRLGPEGLRFGSVQPNEANESANALPLSVETNALHAEIVVTMTGLRADDGSGEIATDNIALAWGRNPRQARTNVRQTSLGQSSFVWHANPGQHTIYIVARIYITLEMPATKYSGILNVTSRSARV